MQTSQLAARIRRHRPLGLRLLRAACLLACGACSLIKAAPAPTTPFLTHGADLHPWHDRSPWDAVWSSNPGHVMVQLPTVRRIYLPPVNTDYLNMKQDAGGRWVRERELAAEDVEAITDLLRQSFVEAIRNDPAANLQIMDAPAPDTLTLSLALVELKPTKVLLNTVADVGGVLVPGSKALEEVGVTGAEAASGAVASGTIAIEMKLADGASGEILAEMKDREADPSSIIPNYRDFEEYGWSRKTIKDWARQFAEVFSTPVSSRVAPGAGISVTPW